MPRSSTCAGLRRRVAAGFALAALAGSARAATYYVEAAAAVNVGVDGSTNMTALADLTVTGGSSNQNRAITNTTAPTGTARWRISEGAADTRTGQEFFRAYTPAYASATTISANATAYADFYMRGTGTSVAANATLYEYNDTTGIVGAAKGTASFTGNATISTLQTMNNASFGNAQFTVASGNRLLVIYAFDMNNSRPAYLWGQATSTTPSGYQAFTVTETVGASITIGNGSAEPPNASISSGQTAALDAFSLQASSGTPTVTSVVVNVATGNTALSGLSINSAQACNGTSYGSITGTIAAGNNTVPLTSSPTVNSTSGSTDLYVCATAAAVAGSVTGNVASVAATGYTSTDNDTTNATLTVTVTSSITIGNGSAEPPNASIGNGQTAALDAFSLQTASGTATVTAVVVNVATGNAALSGLSINGAQACNGTSYGSLTGTIAAGNNTVNLTASPTVNTTSGSANLYVCATAAAVASNATVTGNVASVAAAGYTSTDNDTTNATLTVTAVGVLVLADPGGQPAASTQPPGAAGIAVLKLALSAVNSNLTVTQVRVGFTGTARPGIDVLGLQLWEGTALLGNGAWSSTLNRFVFTPSLTFSAGAAARTFTVTASVAQGAEAGRTFTPSSSTSAPADYVVIAPNGVQAGATVAAGTLTVGTGSGGGSLVANAPAVSVVNPGPGAAPSGAFRVQVRVYVPAGQGGIGNVTAGSVQVATNATFTANLVTLSATTQTAYQASSGSTLVSTIFETPAATPYALAAGAYALYARASDGAGTTVSDPVLIAVSAARKGDGNLLVRDNSSQLCSDCHAIKTHSSETTSARYGNWTANCRDCHQPHSTRNIYLVKEQITPPGVNGYQSSKAVQFYNTTGDAAGSYVNSAAPAGGPFGPCQACHTRTSPPGQPAVARWRNTGNADSHFVGAGTSECKGCHSHAAGFFAVESTGGATDPVKFGDCSSCHGAIWNGMTGAVSKATKHTLGNVVGTNDWYADSTTVTWGNPLSGNLPAARSCVNMCHPDHVHNPVGGTSHANNVHQDATSNASRGVTRDASGNVTAAATAGSPAATDFDNAATNGGMCLSCHRNPVDAAHPAVDRVAYNGSAHNFSVAAGSTWTYTEHDTTTFARNCTKCHADRGDGRPNDGSVPFGAVHYSDYPSLLAGSTNPAGAPATFVCYNCHGNGTVGTNLSGKDLATVFADASAHPVASDSIHNTANEASDTFQSGKFAGANRHVNCIDCHEPHEARNTLHAPGTNTIAATSPLTGVSGVAFTSGASNWLGLASTNWPAVPSTNYAWVPATTGVASEAQICFKCHSSWATATAPTGISGMTETNVALDFNTGNNAYHPVLGPTATANRLNAAQLCTSTAATGCAASSGISWAPGAVMTCSDCHGSDANASGAQGPHGSAGTFILKGPQTAWPVNPATNALFTINPTSAAQPTGVNGLFCLNCHPQNNSTASNNVHRDSNHNRNDTFCVACHTAVPHGSKVTRFLAPGRAPNPYKYYSYGGGPATPTQWVNYVCFTTRPTYTSWNTGNCNATCTTTHNCATAAQTW